MKYAIVCLGYNYYTVPMKDLAATIDVMQKMQTIGKTWGKAENKELWFYADPESVSILFTDVILPECPPAP